MLEMVGGRTRYWFRVGEKIHEAGIRVIGDPRTIDGEFREGYKIAPCLTRLYGKVQNPLNVVRLLTSAGAKCLEAEPHML